MNGNNKGWLCLGLSIFAAGALLCALTLPRLLIRQEATVPAAGTAECRYVVREYRGQVAVFLPLQTYGPKYVTEIPVSSLPQADREALENGIPIYTDAQLTALLQDYGS